MNGVLLLVMMLLASALLATAGVSDSSDAKVRVLVYNVHPDLVSSARSVSAVTSSREHLGEMKIERRLNAIDGFIAEVDASYLQILRANPNFEVHDDMQVRAFLSESAVLVNAT